MTMIEVLKGRLPNDLNLTIESYKKKGSNYEINFGYNGCSATMYLRDSVTPKTHNEHCDYLIASAMVHIGLEMDNKELVKEWLEVQNEVIKKLGKKVKM